jgi:hypothetical protein
MTEIPEHLLKRAQRARVAAQEQARDDAANNVTPKESCGLKVPAKSFQRIYPVYLYDNETRGFPKLVINFQKAADAATLTGLFNRTYTKAAIQEVILWESYDDWVQYARDEYATHERKGKLQEDPEYHEYLRLKEKFKDISGDQR